MYELEVSKVMHIMMNNKLICFSFNQATYRLLEKSYSYNTRKRQKIIKLFYTLIEKS